MKLVSPRVCVDIFLGWFHHSLVNSDPTNQQPMMMSIRLCLVSEVWVVDVELGKVLVEFV